MLLVTILNNDRPEGMVVLDEKTFSTGSRGYQGQGKVVIDGKKYQANFMLVEIGSEAQGVRVMICDDCGQPINETVGNYIIILAVMLTRDSEPWDIHIHSECYSTGVKAHGDDMDTYQESIIERVIERETVKEVVAAVQAAEWHPLTSDPSTEMRGFQVGHLHDDMSPKAALRLDLGLRPHGMRISLAKCGNVFAVELRAAVCPTCSEPLEGGYCLNKYCSVGQENIESTQADEAYHRAADRQAERMAWP